MPPAKPGFESVIKKMLLVALALGGLLSVGYPPLHASAGLLSDILQETASYSSAADITLNSQTMPLLSAAVNIDPNPTLPTGALTLVHGEALMPPENPNLSSGDTISHPAASQISVYTVRPGDSISSIAAQFGVTTGTIVGANDIGKGSVIHPGQELIILPITGIAHVVENGDTLASLAAKYKSDAHDIALYNDLADGVSLTPGDTIIIPNGELSSSASVGSNAPTQDASKPKQTSITKPIAKVKGLTAPLRHAGGPEYDGFYDWPLPKGDGIITQSLHGYNAVDIGAPIGTDILASAAGTVIIAKDNGAWNGGYGNYIVIAHDNGTQTLYAHASKVLVSAGETVRQGELIGKVGRTGEATGPHVHFEVRGATNPFGAIPVGEGD